MARLRLRVGRLDFPNPFLLASGILGSTGPALRAAARAGAGGVVTKSLGAEPRRGYAGPTVVHLECGTLNAVGLSNPSAPRFLPELREARRGGVPVVASIFGSTPAEFARVARAVGREADGLELNLSCPHVKGVGVEVGGDPRRVAQVVRAVKGATRLPVWAKLTPHCEVVEVGRAAERAGADALVATNTLRATAIDRETGRPLLGNRVGGLSGPPLKPVALRCVYELAPEVSIPVVASGGISRAGDALEFLYAGAHAFEVGTALHRGLPLFRELSLGLSRLLERRGLTLERARGMAHGR